MTAVLPALIVVFALIALFGYVMSDGGRERILAALGFFAASRDRARSTTRHHQMAMARAGGGRRAFGKR
jgi:hypothetical protein